MIIVLTVVILIVLALIYFALCVKEGKTIIDPESHLKLLATAYLANNAFLEDEKVINNMSKLGISKEEIINYANIHRAELMKESEEENEENNDK